MRIGKVKESILKRSVLRQVNSGPDSEWGDDIYIQVNPVEGWTLAAPRAVYGAVNAVAAAGAIPSAIALTIIMPESTEEKQLKGLMKELNQLCKSENLALIAGHTTVSPAVKTLILSVTGIGKMNSGAGKCSLVCESRLGQKLEKTRTDKFPVVCDTGTNQKKSLKGMISSPAYTDLDIIMVGHAGREGAALLATEKEEDLKNRYARSFIDTAKHFYDDAGLFDAARILYDCGAVRVHDIREGGVFGALWELAAATGTGLSVDLKKIPIRQHTIEICEFFDLNPYMLLSGGCLLALCPDGKLVMNELKVFAGIIGRTTAGNDRLIHYDTETRYLEPPKMDEIYKERI